jgi:hypothetical protein
MGDDARTAPFRRLAFVALLAGVVPSYVLMRIGAEWIASEENLDEAEASWVDVGYVIADLSVPVVILATVLAGLAVRRRPSGGLLGRAVAILAALLLAAYVVAVWAMTAKPD